MSDTQYTPSSPSAAHPRHSGLPCPVEATDLDLPFKNHVRRPVVDTLTLSGKYVLDRVARVALRLKGFKRRIHHLVGEMPLRMVYLHKANPAAPKGPLVVIHGLGMEKYNHARLVNKLSATHRHIIVVDLPGHGESSTPETFNADTIEPAACAAIHGILGTLPEHEWADQGASVYGNSLGAVVAIRMAGRYPEAIGRLILDAPGGAPMDESAFASFISRFSPTSKMALSTLAKGAAPLFPKWLQPIIRDGLGAQLGRDRIQKFIRSLGAQNLVKSEELKALHHTHGIHTTVLWGELDTILTPCQKSFWEEHAQDFEIFPDGGHSMSVDAPRMLAAAVCRDRESGEK